MAETDIAARRRKPTVPPIVPAAYKPRTPRPEAPSSLPPPRDRGQARRSRLAEPVPLLFLKSVEKPPGRLPLHPLHHTNRSPGYSHTSHNSRSPAPTNFNKISAYFGDKSRHRRISMQPVISAPPPVRGTTTRPACLSAIHEVFFVQLICLSQMLMLAAFAQAMVPAQLIAASFPNTNQGNVAWFSAAYSLTSATFVLPAGRLGDLFGHRLLFITGWAWFGIWSLLAGFAGLVQNSGTYGTKGVVYFCALRAM